MSSALSGYVRRTIEPPGMRFDCASRARGKVARSRSCQNANGGVRMTIVGILIVIILVLLAIYLFQRVRGGSAGRL